MLDVRIGNKLQLLELTPGIIAFGGNGEFATST
jgi:hypothetical protein